jgi:hypothetical protein
MSTPAATPPPYPGGGVLELFLLRRLGITPLLLGAVAIVATVVFGELPGEGKYSGVLQDGCHAPAFATLTLIASALLAKRPQLSRVVWRPSGAARIALAQAVAVVVLMALLGGATEILQGLVGRDEEFDDVVRDVVGASGAACLWLYVTLRGNPHASVRLGRIAALLACSVLAVYWAAPLVRCGLAYWTRDARFPILAQFQSSRDLYFVVDPANPQAASIEHLPDAAATAAALRVSLDNGRWPGMTLTEPVHDPFAATVANQRPGTPRRL